MSFIVKEEDYLAHYGRKGMKWYQHIFGDNKNKSRKKISKLVSDISEETSRDKSTKNHRSHKRAQRRLVNKYVKLQKVYNKYKSFEKDPKKKHDIKLQIDKALEMIIKNNYDYELGGSAASLLFPGYYDPDFMKEYEREFTNKINKKRKK